MIEIDTIRLLSECDKGIKMGISAIDEIWSYISDERLKKTLNSFKDEHNNLNDEIEKQLSKFNANKPNSNPFITLMSKMKIKCKMLFRRNDSTIAKLMIDGAKMGIISLNKYLVQYKAASEKTKNITKKLIDLEQRMIDDLNSFL